MFVLRPHVPIKAAPVVRSVATRTVRKVALCGSHVESLADAPWRDPSWEWWGHASSRDYYSRPMDRYYDLHVKARWQRAGRKGHDYPKWLAMNTTPIYMIDRYSEVPASVKYPKGQILTEFSYAHHRNYFTNHAAWMIAHAITEGVTHIGLFGINYSVESEYMRQRGSAEYWLGQCDARGINVILPEQCSLLADPKQLYGYESHDEKTGLLIEAYRVTRPETIVPAMPGQVVKKAVPPPKIAEAIAAEEADFIRPSWAIGPLPEVPVPSRTDGDARKEV